MERLLTLYSEVQSTDVRWLWYPFIAIGKITLLQGDPGDGKSTMMMNLIAEALDMDVSKFYHGDYYLEEEVKTMRGKGIASRKKSSI